MAVLDSHCPLSGLRVTEIGDESAAYGARLLADLGAEVVMVEPLEGGVIRHIAPFRPPSAGGESYEHLFLNAGKRSVQLDLLAADGQQRLLDVIAQSDVLIDAGPRPPLPRAITSGMLRAARPDLVRVSLRPYGPEGPCRSRTGNDLTAQAAGDLLAISGDPQDPPTQGPVDCAFKLTGHAVASAVMIGLRSREQSGHGADFQVSAQEAVAFSVTQSANVNDFHIAGTIPVRPGLSNAVRCGDGRWAGANVRPDHYAEFLGPITAAGGEHDYTPDDWERGTAGPNPLDNANMELAKSYAVLVTRDEFVDSMQGTGQVAMPLYDLSEVASEPHYAECEQFTDISTGDATGRTFSLPQSPMRDLGIDVTLDPAPQLGADNSLLETIPRRRDTVSPVIAVASDPAKLLGGLRVVELSWILASPIGGRMLANFGAEVIRIESSARPDALRNYRRPDGTAQPNLAGLFNCVNTGKRSLTLDLRQERTKELLRDLIGTADLVIDNYALGSLARMGFRYEYLAERNPGLVMLHMPGCGPRGRCSRERTLGNLLMAASGLNSLMGFEGRDPRGVGIAYPDLIAPHLLVTLALAAIQMRDRNGLGRELTIDQLGGTVSLLGAAWARYQSEGAVSPRPGNRSPQSSPHGVFPTLGEARWVAMAATSDREWHALRALVGDPRLDDDRLFGSLAARKANEDELEARITTWTADQERWELARRLQESGVPAAAVADLGEMVTADPQLPDYYQAVRQPSAPDLDIWVDAEPIRLAGVTHRLQRAPELGEHSERVLREILGLSREGFRPARRGRYRPLIGRIAQADAETQTSGVGRLGESGGIVSPPAAARSAIASLMLASALLLLACSEPEPDATAEPSATTATAEATAIPSATAAATAATEPPEPPSLGSLLADIDALIEPFSANDPSRVARIGQAGDPRYAWFISDMMRFTFNAVVLEAMEEAFSDLTGAPGDRAYDWTGVTNYLIAEDVPAPPGYREWKRELYVRWGRAWAPFFDDLDADVDWRLISWGGVGIDDREVARAHLPCFTCIPALNDPALTGTDGGDWYPDERLVFGVEVNGEVRAYPKNQMEVHEMVNDTLGGRRIALVYCTLCGSAQAFLTDEPPDGIETPTGTLELRTSGLLSRSNKVMFELHTFSFFDTFRGAAVSGPLQGFELTPITVSTATWGAWKQAHPDSTIVARDGGLGRAYRLEPLGGRDDDGPIFPIGDVDPRLPVQDQVLGVEYDGGTMAFPVVAVRSQLARGLSVTEGEITVRLEGGALRAFGPDDQPITTHQAFWFAWSQFHPETALWSPGGRG